MILQSQKCYCILCTGFFLNEQFILSFQAPISDSCMKSENLNIKIDAAYSQEKKDQFELQKKDTPLKI